MLLVGCSEVRHPDWVASGRKAMVATDHELASQAGLAMLKRGGNAADAAIAVSLALAASRPQSTGLGGGGFFILRSHDGEVYALDFRERAPMAADADMYVRAMQAHPERGPPSQTGFLAAGVPGQLAGLEEVHRRWATLDWQTLATPAVEIAENGFAVDEAYVTATEDALKRFESDPTLRESCGYTYRVHLRNGDLRKVGDRLCQPELAKFLRQVAAHGTEYCAHNLLAEPLAKHMAARGGIVTERDVRDYRVTEREPLRGTFRDCDIIAMPPPSSGGVCLIETLNILERVATPPYDHNLGKHLLIESMKHAFADRARWLGDADFVPVPTDLLTSKAYAATLASAVHADSVEDIDTYGAVQIPDDGGTSHYSIVDRWGNVVVSTETINGYFGSLAAVDEWGVILNNEMDDFTVEPGQANLFGLQQSARNAVAPRKRPLSSMTPTIVLRNGSPILMLGASGGPRIISSVLNVLVAVVDQDEPLAEAISEERVHHQWQPDAVFFDQDPPDALRKRLVGCGHELGKEHKTGIVQAVHWEDGVWKLGHWVGASDPRKGGKPAGY